MYKWILQKEGVLLTDVENDSVLLTMDDGTSLTGINAVNEAGEFDWNLLGDYKGNLDSINSYGFYQTSLKEMHIPEGVVSIRKCAFKNCHDLIRVYLPESLRKIEREAFSNCKKLEQIFIPSKTVVEERAFENCIQLKNVRMFIDSVFAHNSFLYCKGLESLQIVLKSNKMLEIPFSCQDRMHSGNLNGRDKLMINYINKVGRRLLLVIDKETGNWKTLTHRDFRPINADPDLYC